MSPTTQATQNQTPSLQLHTAAKASPSVSRFDTDELPSLDEIRAGGTYLKEKNLDDKALSEGLGSVNVGGIMVDAASIRIVMNTVRKADLIGM